MLKFKFDSNLDFQKKAINSVVDLFEGQPSEESLFYSQLSRKHEIVDFAYVGNKLVVDQEQILINLKQIQDQNDIEISKKLDGLNFTVEMETGTGKTYVYLRTIFELNKKFGFKKFIIVVPSIAIKEGVSKSISMTKDHFGEIYEKTPFNSYVYDPKDPNKIADFARSNNIQILIMNIDAFRKTVDNVDDESKANIIHRARDQNNGRKPIEYIQAVNPILIIDEPQSVDNTPKAKEAIKTLNPLFILRYSATHRELYNSVYSLDAIKAYDQKLVKQIQVTPVTEEITGDRAYVKLVKTDNKVGIKAKINIHCLEKGGVIEKSLTVKNGIDLYDLSNKHDAYKNAYQIQTIDCTPNNEFIEFSNGIRIEINEEFGNNDEQIQRAQIRATIKQHLDTELKLRSHKIKVLSLFFIDRVANYRSYNEENKPIKGKFSEWFEELFIELINKPQYKDLKKESYTNFEKYDISKIHDGYFSKDKKGIFKDTSGNTADDDSIYDKIMKNKEKLLSFEEPLRFIFSHSALKEGWDNPNVFQICTLNETKSPFKKRQEIGRGLRLPVNQDGDRIIDDNINRLTVIANESYEQFCKTLQLEYEKEGIEFGKVSIIAFKNIQFVEITGNVPLGSELSEKLFNNLVENSYLDKNGYITEKFTPNTPNFELIVDEQFKRIESKIIDVLKDHLIKNRIENTKNKAYRKLNKAVYLDPEFKELWDRISQKTIYSVEYDTENLIAEVLDRFKTSPKISKSKIKIQTASVDIDKKGVTGTLLRSDPSYFYDTLYIPDILSLIDRELEYKITRKAIAEIIIRSNRISELQNNPYEFCKQLIIIIKNELNRLITKGIKYEKIDGYFYEMRLFEIYDFKDYFINKAVVCKHHIYDVVEYDSETERRFAEGLDKREDIKLFAKLPNWFKIQTPLGTYNPDWAIVKHGDEVLYFVKETKGTIDYSHLRNSEEQKIQCGKKHFEALGTDIKFGVAVSADKID
jgi:type III restriction enzyme